MATTGYGMMKYILLLLSLILSTASAQPVRFFGIKTGLSSATWVWHHGDNRVGNIDRRTGFDASLFLESPAGSLFSFCIEAHYIQKGMRQEIPYTSVQFPNGNGEAMTIDIRQDHLSILVLPKIRLETDAFEIYALAGPRVDVALSNRVTVQGLGLSAFYYTYGMYGWAGSFRSPLLGVSMGAGVLTRTLFPFATGIEFRFSPDLRDGLDDPQRIRSTSMEFLLTIGI